MRVRLARDAFDSIFQLLDRHTGVATALLEVFSNYELRPFPNPPSFATVFFE
jgi:hypothetical protein